MMKNLIMIPYAYGGNTGVSIQNTKQQLTTYMKNNCTALLSAKESEEDFWKVKRRVTAAETLRKRQ